ncbi:MAG: hypothetical protein AAGG59_05515 [Bacteroidota bacterium]
MNSGKYKPLAGNDAEYIHLDIDGPYAQFAVSGILSISITTHFFFICQDLRKQQDGSFSGKIAEIEALDERIQGKELKLRLLPNKRLEITFELSGESIFQVYEQKSPFFESIKMEVDYVIQHIPVLGLDTTAKPELELLPEELKGHKVSVQDIFARAGFEISMPMQATSIDLSSPLQNPDEFDDDWKPNELHDAITRFWSQSNHLKSDWALWVLLAGVYHPDPSGYEGLMFDFKDEFQRQGAVLFYGSDLLDVNGHYSSELVKRNKFFFTCHEIGHAFNLAHPHEVEEKYRPWAIDSSNPQYGFMNHSMEHGFSFEKFQFRFKDDELMFMRHAPRKLIKMGASAFIHDNSHASHSNEDLELSITFSQFQFEFLEPVMAELVLKNVSEEQVELDNNLLTDYHNIHITVEKEGGVAQDYIAFISHTRKPCHIKLKPDKSISAPLFLAYSRQGWIISTPGIYMIRASIRTHHGVVRSRVQTVQILTPKDKNVEERVAQDFFSHDVGRVMAFDGTRELQNVNCHLKEVIARMKNSKAALHAGVTLAMPMTNYFKNFNPGNKQLTIFEPNLTELRDAHKELHDILIVKKYDSLSSLGRLEYDFYHKELKELESRIGIASK